MTWRNSTRLQLLIRPVVELEVTYFGTTTNVFVRVCVAVQEGECETGGGRRLGRNSVSISPC